MIVHSVVYLKEIFHTGGVDNNLELLNNKIKKYSNKFKLLKSYKIPFKNNSFDCILINHVIGHIARTDLC